MSNADRAEMEAFWERWLEDNRLCEQKRNWEPLAEYFAEDATYGWNCGPNDEFMAVGREQIRRLAFDLEMRGLEGWSYPYQVTMIDDKQAMIIGFWKQQSEHVRADGSHYIVAGLGASWFGYKEGLFAWQRDFFDHANAGALFFEMLKDGVLSAGMKERIDAGVKGQRLPGHYPRSGMPVPLWPNEMDSFL